MSVFHVNIFFVIFLFFSEPPFIVTDNVHKQEWFKFSFYVFRMSFESEGNYMSVYHIHFQGEGSRWTSKRGHYPLETCQVFPWEELRFFFYSMGVKEREFNYDSTP